MAATLQLVTMLDILKVKRKLPLTDISKPTLALKYLVFCEQSRRGSGTL